jgi:hypothetical protein
MKAGELLALYTAKTRQETDEDQLMQVRQALFRLGI